MRRTTTITAATAATLITLLGLSGCGSSGSSAGGASSPSASASPSASSSPAPSASAGGSDSSAPATITIKDFAYKASGPVKAGSTVMIKNDDTEAHTVTADSAGGFDVKIPPGKTVKLKAPAKGTYKYHCTYHSDMHGTLTVR